MLFVILKITLISSTIIPIINSLTMLFIILKFAFLYNLNKFFHLAIQIFLFHAFYHF